MSESDDLIWHDAVSVDELEDSKPMSVQVDRKLLALVKVGEDIFAVDCVCTHEFALLSDGYVEEKIIECPLHSARFELETGKVIEGPTETNLETYPVRISGTLVQVGLVALPG